MAGEYSIGDARVYVYFVIVTIDHHVVAGFRNSDVRVMMVDDHVTVITLATTCALRWTALSGEEPRHTRGTSHSHSLHEEHVRVMRIHLNIYLLL